MIEGDELYTKVDKNVPASESEGWTIVLMERGSRFLWELECGPKDEQLFKQALSNLAKWVRVRLKNKGAKKFRLRNLSRFANYDRTADAIELDTTIVPKAVTVETI